MKDKGTQRSLQQGSQRNLQPQLQQLSVRITQTDTGNTWEATLPDDATQVTAIVRQRTGRALVQQRVTSAELASGQAAMITVAPDAPMMYTALSRDATTIRLYGRVYDVAGLQRLSQKQVVIWHELLDRPVALAQTDSEGNFVAELPASVANEKVQVFLSEHPQNRAVVDVKTLQPRELFLIPVDTTAKSTARKSGTQADDSADDSGKDDCGCHDQADGSNKRTVNTASPKVFSSMEAFTAAADATQTLGGACEPLNKPNQTVEEFTFFKIIRTSQMPVRAYKLNKDTDHFDAQNINVAMTWLSSDPATAYSSPVAWDKKEDSVIYQNTYFGHGRILVFKQIYAHAGHSLGNVQHTIALPPGAKEQYVQRDWNRRETGSRSEDLQAVDELLSEMTHNRDISEVVKGLVKEHIDANSTVFSKANTGGFSIGADLTALVGFPLGVGGGYQGSETGGHSGAEQKSVRESAMDSIQKIQDKTNQSASSVRSQRSTVIQTVTQSENLNIKTSVVSNHNHCHAINILFHEILAHYRVETRLADVQECLFIPLKYMPFTADIVARYRNILETYCKLPLNSPLRKGFDAAERLMWYQTGTPPTAQGGESIMQWSGEMSLMLSFQQPRNTKPPLTAAPTSGAAKSDANLRGYFDVTEWAAYLPLLEPEYSESTLEDSWNELLAINTKVGDTTPFFLGTLVPIMVRNYIKKLRLSATVVGTSMPLSLDLTTNGSGRNGVIGIQIKSALADSDMTGSEITSVTFSTAPSLGTYGTAKISKLQLRYDTEHYHAIPIVNKIWAEPTALDANLSVSAVSPTGTQTSNTAKEADEKIVKHLCQHLNQYIEHYHRYIWLNMDADRRWLMLDAIPFITTQANEIITVASLVDNRVVGVLGNCIILPVAKGVQAQQYKLPPNKATLYDLYKDVVEPSYTRITIPTSGVFAETMLSSCGVCEKIDDSVTQDWDKYKSDEPTLINPVETGSNAQPSPNLTPQGFSNPIINIQNTPNLPDPTGMGALGNILATQGLFKDMTGLEGNQHLAASTLEQTVKAYGMNADLTKGIMAKAQQEYYANNGNKIIDSINKSGLDDAKKKELKEKALQQMIGATQQEQPQGERDAADYAARAAAIQNDPTLSDDQKREATVALAKGMTGNKETEDETFAKIDASMMRSNSKKGSVSYTKADGSKIESTWDGKEDEDASCQKAIKQWDQNIRTPLFNAYTSINPVPTNIADIEAALSPIAIQLRDKWHQKPWFDFYKNNTGQDGLDHTIIRLISNTKLAGTTGQYVMTRQLAVNSTPQTISFRTDGSSRLVPSPYVPGNCATTNQMALVLGVRYSFNAYQDPDQISFTDSQGNNIIAPAIFGSNIFQSSTGSPLVQSIKDAFIPISAFGNATSFIVTVTPTGTNIALSVFDLDIDLVILDPWPFER